ncbi:hypothetical protein SD81_029130 [Tolypothrix campylonemoides VB511288]|nr:hypothetical protein SD81_029130 [Tolypothrix campylonemoides VB511288]
MLKLQFIHQSKQLKSADIANKEVAETGRLKRYESQIETVLNFCAKIVKMTCAITDETEIGLLNSYNFLNHCESESLDSHRGSGRIQACSRAVDIFFSVVTNEIVPRWIIAKPL